MISVHATPPILNTLHVAACLSPSATCRKRACHIYNSGPLAFLCVPLCYPIYQGRSCIDLLPVYVSSKPPSGPSFTAPSDLDTSILCLQSWLKLPIIPPCRSRLRPRTEASIRKPGPSTARRQPTSPRRPPIPLRLLLLRPLKPPPRNTCARSCHLRNPDNTRRAFRLRTTSHRASTKAMSAFSTLYATDCTPGSSEPLHAAVSTQSGLWRWRLGLQPRQRVGVSSSTTRCIAGKLKLWHTAMMSQFGLQMHTAHPGDEKQDELVPTVDCRGPH